MNLEKVGHLMNDSEEREFCSRVIELSSKITNLIAENPHLRDVLLPVIAKTFVNLIDEATVGFKREEKDLSTFYAKTFDDKNSPCLVSVSYGEDVVKGLLAATGRESMNLTEVLCLLSSEDDVDYESVTVH